MHTFAESNVLLNTRATLPGGFRLALEEFQNGWDVVRTGGTQRIAKKVRTMGWSFLRVAEGVIRSGVGKTEQSALSSAMDLAVRRAGSLANVIEIDHIEVSNYPWFFLARVKVGTFRIQEESVLSVADPTEAQDSMDEAVSATAMPTLKAMLTGSGTASAGIDAVRV